jgi:hypothetical protein
VNRLRLDLVMTNARPPRTDTRETNKQVISRYRESGGTSADDAALVLLTTTGVRSGKPHTTPVCVQEDGNR